MSERDQSSRRIRILRDEVSRKIAAGEVIERPSSVVRELLDNGIDAGASSIDVYLEAGGIARVRVVDDGQGMDREDLDLCWRPHATSKIETADDLLTVKSLGFRGEALSSLAVAGRLEIVSSPSSSAGANRLVVHGGRLVGLEGCQGKKGTAAEVSELFFDFPARRKFLKSPSAESGLCRAVFIDRATAFPAINFRLFTDGSLRSFLPAAGEAERIASAHAQGLDARALAMGEAGGNGFSVRVIAGDPSLRRRDRRLMQCFVNRRRVPEFSLIQAAEFGFSGFIPGGWYPIAFIFVEIDPSLVDFNIHPAKKEVRFRNLGDVHSAVVRAVRGRLGAGQPSSDPSSAGYAPAGTASRPAGDGSWWELVGPVTGAFTPQPRRAMDAPRVPARFLGQIFGVFLAFELEDRLLLVDQHAAHEKVIFQKLSALSPAVQDLLIPLVIDVSEDEDAALSAGLSELAAMGIALKRTGARTYEVTSLSSDFAALGEGDLARMLKESLDTGREWKKDLLARAACRLALKAGDPVDAVTAMELLSNALSLEVPRCPHGRPIWHEMTREALYRLVDRPT